MDIKKISKKKDYFLRKKFKTQKNNFINKFYFFLIAISQICKNYAILINHGRFFQKEDSL